MPTDSARSPRAYGALMQRLIRGGLAAVMVIAALFITAPPALAAPGRADGNRITVLIHGFDREADTNCSANWTNAKNLLNNNGWANVYTFGYYGGDTNCDVEFAGTTDTRIQEVGRQFAWTAYYFWSGHGVPIDVIAHSMGGLIALAAIEGVNRYGVAAAEAVPDVSALNVDMQDVGAAAWPSGWPPYLYIEDIVTLGTPHQGASSALVDVCAITHEQCSDMRPGSGFLSWLGGQPRSQMGTDYTYLGSQGDQSVYPESATNGYSADHWADYYPAADGDVLTHTELKNDATSSDFNAWYRNYPAAKAYGSYSPPLVHAMYAIYNHRAY